MSDQDENFKLTYLPGQARIRLVLTKAACDKSIHPPEDVIKRAVARLDQGVQDGSLAFYNLYSARLELLWQRMRAAKFKPEKKIALTLAAGTPPLPEVKVVAGPAPFIASLTIDATPAKIATWRFEFVKLTVQKRLAELEIKAHPDSAMLQAMFVRALRGKKIDHMPLSAAPPLSTKQGEHFHVLPRGMTGDLVLVINNISSVATQEARTALLAWLEKYIEAAGQKSAGKRYLFLKDDVESRLKSFLRGPERLRIDLPSVILAALAEPKQPTAKAFVTKTNELLGADQNAKTTKRMILPPQPRHAISLDFNGNAFFEIAVDSNRMNAKLKIISERVYDNHDTLTLEKITNYTRTKGIIYGIKPTFFDELKTAITERRDTKIFDIAVGTSAITPSEPYLRSVYKDSKNDKNDSSLRDRQNGNFVKKDEIIAEVAYKNPGVNGKDVFGTVVHFIPPMMSGITCGANVEVHGETKFIATKDGLPTVTENSVSVEPGYIHKGNVNLTTGNINFDGPVLIMGNVEYGATVSARGDLEVKGVIEEAVIKCGGTLRAAGIISGSKGLIKVGGDAYVSFINNARMEVHSDLFVTGNISNSKILVAKTLTITSEDSLIVGGSLYFGHVLTCKNLGKSVGQTTTVNGGADPFLQRKIAIRINRLHNLESIKEEIKKSSRHLGGIKAASTTKRHISRRDDLKKSLDHITQIITRVEEQLVALKAQVSTFDETKISVKGMLSQNCKITLDGKHIVIPADVVEVGVFSKRIKGSFIVALTEVSESSEQKSA
jgi:uncharacterized protein (DUF342 family)